MIHISIAQLLIALSPILLILAIFYRWSISTKETIYGTLRMVTQLFLVGYALIFIFKKENPYIVLATLLIMTLMGSWIALRTMELPRQTLYFKAFSSLFLGGGFVFILITQCVLSLKPWYAPDYTIAIGGMVFSNAMHAISLSGERLQNECKRGMPYDEARKIALKASLIPITNSFFAVGLVSLPGVMTGQILAGVSPFIAARYQMVIMAMVFSTTGFSSILFLKLLAPHFRKR